MATTIINPTPINNSDTDGGTGFLLGAILLIAFGFLFFIFGVPLIRQGLNGLSSGGIQINLPKTLDVKVQQSK